MKKFVCIISIMALMLCGVSALAATDWASMTEEEIRNEINMARAELAVRDLKSGENGTVIVDSNGILLTLDDIQFEESYDDAVDMAIEFTLVNNSDKNIGISTEDCYINGWQVSPAWGTDIDAGMKSKSTGYVFEVNNAAEVSKYEELEDMKIVFRIYDADSYDTIEEGIVVNLDYNK